MAVITSSNLATALVKLVAVDALPALMGNLVVGHLVTWDFEPEVAQAGDAVSITYPGGCRFLELAHRAEATFTVPDVTKVIAVPDLLRLYMHAAMVDLAEQIDCNLLGVASSLPEYNLCGEPITTRRLGDIESRLFTHGVAWGDQKCMVVNPPGFQTMRELEGWTEGRGAYEVGLKALVDGPVGAIRNIYVLRSQHVTGVGVVIARDALGMSIRRLPKPLPGSGAIAEYAELGNFGIRVVMDYRPNTLQQRFTVECLYGVGTLNRNHGLRIV